MTNVHQLQQLQPDLLAAMEQRDERVWVLLFNAWQPLDQEVICRLLWCSQSMAQLVHATCAGR